MHTLVECETAIPTSAVSFFLKLKTISITKSQKYYVLVKHFMSFRHFIFSLWRWRLLPYFFIISTIWHLEVAPWATVPPFLPTPSHFNFLNISYKFHLALKFASTLVQWHIDDQYIRTYARYTPHIIVSHNLIWHHRVWH